MESKREPYYLGIDLNDDYAMISYYQQNMSEPDTVSTIAGGQMYHVPTLLARRKNMGMWYYGEEAKKMAKTSEVICVDALLKRAVNGEKIGIGDENYEASDLLALFLRKMIDLPLKLGNGGHIDRLVLTVDRLTRENMDVFWKVASRLELTAEQFMVVDHRESFYYFALSQKENLWLHDVFLFGYQDSSMYAYDLRRDMRTTPQVVSIRETGRYSIGEDKDQSFLDILKKEFENRMISTVLEIHCFFRSSGQIF